MKRIQRKRTKGWRMPENTIYVGRPTKWGNPYRKGEWYFHSDDIISDPFGCEQRYCETVEESVDLYKRYIDREIEYRRLNISELVGHDLACFCNMNSPCHADYLLELCERVELIGISNE